ncbi:prolipoprotein diacylglyceryl transferase [Schumannella luteola]|uniref:Phosphatidylglycerol--prolipoprotein diacylglyceryl transferase n=1 Tax=Schumannella luteola TaxID=472059 RepID=A0A852YFF8_9MICO|nr:prolipoprotein diacylglyceryl transferase [Schumannella luteola]
MAVPASIPSPPSDWQIIQVGQWIHSWFPAWPAAWGQIHVYALCILAGIIAAILMANHRLNQRGAERWVILDIAIWTVALGIIVARFYHVFTHPGDYFGPGKNTWNITQPGSIWAVWEGGNAYYGALLGGALGAYIGSRFTGLRFTAIVDAIAPGMLAAQALGRLGNWFNHELFGLPTPDGAWWGLQIEQSNAAWPEGLPAGTLFQPTFLYEIIWNVIGIIVIYGLRKKLDLQWGKVLAVYLIWQGIGRSFFESIRVDPSEYYFGIRANVWAAVGAIVIGLVILVVQTRRHPGAEPSPYLPGREWTPTSAVDSGETYSDSDDDETVVDEESDEAATSGAKVAS